MFVGDGATNQQRSLGGRPNKVHLAVSLETIRSNLHCILDHSAGERKLAPATASTNWWAIESADFEDMMGTFFWMEFKGDMHGYNINDICETGRFTGTNCVESRVRQTRMGGARSSSCSFRFRGVMAAGTFDRDNVEVMLS